MPQVQIEIIENDTYGDGWQGQWVRIYQNINEENIQIAAHTLEAGASGSDVFNLESGVEYTWSFGEGSWIEESSFSMVRTDTGEELAASTGVGASGSFTLEAGEVVEPVYHYLDLWEASIDAEGELQDAPGFDIDFDEFGPPNSYTIDNDNEQLIVSTSLLVGDGDSPNFKAELPDVGPGGSIVFKLSGWNFGPNAGKGHDEGEPTRVDDGFAVEQIAIVLQEYEPDSLDNAESQQFFNLGFMRNEGPGYSWHDLVFDVFSGNYEGAPGWHGIEVGGESVLGVYDGQEVWGLPWWPKRVVAAHWEHSTVSSRNGLVDFLGTIGSPYSGGSIENDEAHEAYNKLIQQFFGYYRFSRIGDTTIKLHYSPDGVVWYLLEESNDFNVQNRMGLHFWCRLSDSVVTFEDIIASENTIITDVFEAINAALDAADGPASYTFTPIPTSEDEPGGDFVGMDPSDFGPGVFIQCDGGFDVYVKVDGAWNHQDSAFNVYSMLTAGVDEMMVYSNGSQAFGFPRHRLLTDSPDDEDDLVDTFVMGPGQTMDISSTEHTVSGQDPIEFPGETCTFAQVLEGGRISRDYSVSSDIDGVTITPPEGKDGQEIEVRLFI